MRYLTDLYFDESGDAGGEGDALGCSSCGEQNCGETEGALGGLLQDIGSAVTRAITPGKQQMAALPALAALIGAATGNSAVADVGLSLASSNPALAATQLRGQRSRSDYRRAALKRGIADFSLSSSEESFDPSSLEDPYLSGFGDTQRPTKPISPIIYITLASVAVAGLGVWAFSSS